MTSHSSAARDCSWTRAPARRQPRLWQLAKRSNRLILKYRWSDVAIIGTVNLSRSVPKHHFQDRKSQHSLIYFPHPISWLP